MTINPSERYGVKGQPELRKPPRWAESLLIFLLRPCDQETIPGDLLEEYREERLPLLGHARADFWYIQQVFTIACFQHFEGGPMKRILLFLCFFTLAAITWLSVMEIILHHPGSVLRICIEGLLALQSLSTILFLIFRGKQRARGLLMTGGFLITLFGISAAISILRPAHFEGYILLIGLALILQGVVTIITLVSVRGANKLSVTCQ